MNFGQALQRLSQGHAVRLATWSTDVSIKLQVPDANSKMTAPYLYVESRFGRVPWNATQIETLSVEWEIAP